jgi:tRNA_anti-like
MKLPTHTPAFLSVSRLLAIILAAIACTSCGPLSSEEPRPTTDSQTSGIEITADALHAAYVENGVAGDMRFRGQVVAVNGRVGDIQTYGDRPVINLLANKGKGVVQCYFEPDQAEAVAKIVHGQQVKIKGRCDGFTEGAVLLKECVMK